MQRGFEDILYRALVERSLHIPVQVHPWPFFFQAQKASPNQAVGGQRSRSSLRCQGRFKTTYATSEGAHSLTPGGGCRTTLFVSPAGTYRLRWMPSTCMTRFPCRLLSTARSGTAAPSSSRRLQGEQPRPALVLGLSQHS